jgi:hypothetical protein
LKLPNTALRYKPPLTSEEVLSLYQSHGIEGVKDLHVADSTAAEGGTQNLPRSPKAETAVVWKLHADKTMEPVQVSLGITDHAHTEISAVLHGDLKEADDLIIRSVAPKAAALGNVGR